MKKFLFLFAFVTLVISTVPVNVQAVEAEVVVVNSEEEVLSPRADIIEWRYKIENYKVYKRLYNRSTGEWIGDWILCE